MPTKLGLGLFITSKLDDYSVINRDTNIQSDSNRTGDANRAMRLFLLIFRNLSMAVVTDKTTKMMRICPISNPKWNEKSGKAMDDSLPNIERRKLENPSP